MQWGLVAGIPTLVFYLQEHQVLIVKMGEKSPCASNMERGKVTSLKICQSVLFFLTRLAFKVDQLTRAQWTGVLSEPTMRKAPSCHPVSRKRGEVGTEGCAEVTAWGTGSGEMHLQDHGLLSPPHSASLRACLLYCRAFYPVHHVHLSTKNYKAYCKALCRASLQRQSEHQNQTRIWWGRWNDQTK